MRLTSVRRSAIRVLEGVLGLCQTVCSRLHLLSGHSYELMCPVHQRCNQEAMVTTFSVGVKHAAGWHPDQKRNRLVCHPQAVARH